MTTYYACVFLAEDSQYLKKLVTEIPNPDAGGIAEEVLAETPHAMSIILIDHDFRVVNEYRSKQLR